MRLVLTRRNLAGTACNKACVCMSAWVKPRARAQISVPLWYASTHIKWLQGEANQRILESGIINVDLHLRGLPGGIGELRSDRATGRQQQE